MPRYARIHVPGGLFHVICRFHGHLFHLDYPNARDKYLELLGRRTFCCVASNAKSEKVKYVPKSSERKIAEWVLEHDGYMFGIDK